LVLGARLSEEAYSRLLRAVAAQAGVTLENLLLAEDMAERIETERRIARDMEIAKQVQARLFPRKLPSLDTLEYAGRCIPAREVGGDYYDFLNLGAGRMGIVLADIVGKGIPGALLMANLQADVRSQCAVASQDLPQFLKSVNQSFFESTDEGRYATLFFGDYQDSTRRLRYANCGHNPPFAGALKWNRRTSECHSNRSRLIVGIFPWRRADHGWRCPGHLYGRHHRGQQC
jgi:serine phosphatase RsbU (regulator of sigma subunit)